MDERLQAILDPGGTIGRGMAQAGLMEYQKNLVGTMEAAGAATLSRDEQIGSAIAGRVFGKVIPGGGYLIDAGLAAQAVERSHCEGIEQMEKRGVAGFDTGTIQLANPRGVGDNITMRYWTDVSAVEFGGNPKTYLEPADRASERIVRDAKSNNHDDGQGGGNRLRRLERLAEDYVESAALEEVHNAIASGKNYGAEVSRGLQDIQNDYDDGSLDLSSLESAPEVQVAQAEPEVIQTFPAMKI